MVQNRRQTYMAWGDKQSREREALSTRLRLVADRAADAGKIRRGAGDAMSSM